MAVTFQRTEFKGRMTPFWREPKVLPGGFNLAQTFPVGTFIQRGALVAVDFDNMSASVVKVAKVIAGGTTTKPRVSKNNYFVVGDIVSKFGDGSASPSITAIDTSNDGFDILTLSTAYSGLTADDLLVESTEYGYYDCESGDTGALKVVASGASTGQINLANVTPYHGEKGESLAANDYVVLKLAEAKYLPNMILGSDLKIEASQLAALDVAYDAIALADVVPEFPSDWRLNGGPCLKANPNIMFIKQ